MHDLYILTRYYFPHYSVDSEYVYRMVQRLMDELPGVRINICHIDVPYSGGAGPLRAPIGNVLKLKQVFNTKVKIARFVGNFIEGYKLIKMACNGASAVICMTNPPLITYWAGRLFGRKQIPWASWTFDLYPYLFVSADMVKEENVVYKHLKRSIENLPPNLLIALGEKQACFMQNRFGKHVPQVVFPCGVHDDVMSNKKPTWKDDNNKIYFAYVGNLGEAHSSDFLIDFIDCLDAKKHACILALYGSKAKRVLKSVGNSPAVKILNWIEKEDLFHIDVHLVSLLPNWTHMCVPSKGVSAVCYEGAILFNGSEHSDTWQMLNKAGWVCSETVNRAKRKEQIMAALSQISDPAKLKEKKVNAARLKEDLLVKEKDAYKNIAEWVKNSIKTS